MAERYTRVDPLVPRTNRLLSSVDDFLNLLPQEVDEGQEIWIERPVPLEKWISSPEYMNLAIKLSEKQFELLEAMDDINPDTNEKTEFVAEWGKGSGKDFMCALAGLRQVYQLLCLRNPYGYYGMAKNTGIQLVNVAYTKEQAQEVFLKQVKGLLRGSPWFLRENPQIIRTRIKFRHEIEFVSAAADGDSVEGQNVFFAVMDEASAFRDSNVVKSMRKAEGQKVDRSADAIYNVLRTSSRSRFPTVGKVAIISYPRYRDDFTQLKRKENANTKHGWTSGPYATWEVNPLRKREDFHEDYRKNPEQAAAMYECKPPWSEDSYVAFPNRFIDCVMESIKMEDLKSPIDEDGCFDPFFKAMPGRWHVIHVDLGLRKDRCALALARQGNPVQKMTCPCQKYNWPNTEVCVACGRHVSKWIKQDLPTMVVTLLKDFKPQQFEGGSREVDFADVREDIMWLRDRGHRIWALSYDGWQSADSIQTMRKVLGTRIVRDRWGKEIRTEEICNVLSVDRNTEAHDTLKEFIYDGRFFITPPKNIKSVDDWEKSEEPVAIAFREWRSLRIINSKKVDHPVGGSKDFADALAGCAYWIARAPMVRSRMPIVAGWQETPVSRR